MSPEEFGKFALEMRVDKSARTRVWFEGFAHGMREVENFSPEKLETYLEELNKLNWDLE